MATIAPNVFLPMPLPLRKDLRAALAQVIRSIQAKHHLTDETLADLLGISNGTVANVRNERTDLNQETIAKIGARFGPETLDPWSACFGGRNLPREDGEGRINLRIVTRALDKMAEATDPDSDGGTDVTHRELGGMMGELVELQSMVNRMVARGHRLGLVAA